MPESPQPNEGPDYGTEPEDERTHREESFDLLDEMKEKLPSLSDSDINDLLAETEVVYQRVIVDETGGIDPNTTLDKDAPKQTKCDRIAENLLMLYSCDHQDEAKKILSHFGFMKV